MSDADLLGFIACYNPEIRHERTETISKVNPDELAVNITENLHSALESFHELHAQLENRA